MKILYYCKTAGLILIIFLCFSVYRVSFAQNDSCININNAPKEELMKIKHIGEARAAQIIKLREEKLFSSIDDLSRVRGIGPARISDIKEQGLACIGSEARVKTETRAGSPEIISESIIPKNKETKPVIELFFEKNNPVNEEIEITVVGSNLKNKAYDIKISIEEKEKNISDIYNEKSGEWQSSHYYINGFFSGSFFKKIFRLKIKEDALNFYGETDILIRIRESGKSEYLEHKEKINIAPPEQKNVPSIEKDLTLLSGQASLSGPDIKIYLIAFILSAFSGITVLTLKRKTKNI